MKLFKKLGQKGFTLAEMLIVMAVVVVLAAAVIPTITGQTEAAKQSNDLSALRDAYIQAYSEIAMRKAGGQTIDATNGLAATGISVTLQQAAPASGSTPFALIGNPKIAEFDMTQMTGTITPGTAQTVTFTFTSALAIKGVALS